MLRSGNDASVVIANFIGGSIDGFVKYMDGKWADPNLLDDGVRDFLSSGDHLIINVEGPLSEQKQVVRPNGVAALVHTMNPAAIDWNDHYNADVAAVNAFLIANADKYGYDYIDIASPLTDADGTLRSDLTEDGCHPNEAAYAIWAETIKNKIIK